MRFILEILLTGLAILIASYNIQGIYVDSYLTAVEAGVLLSIVNITIGLLLRILTFPLNILTLGLVSFIISVCMVLLVSHLMANFKVNGFLHAAELAIILAIFKMIFHKQAKKKSRD